MDYGYGDYGSYGEYGAGGAGVDAAGLAMLAGFGMVYLLIFLVTYLYFAVVLMVLAKKTNTENAWWAWIPVLNLLLFLNVARKPLWWILLLFIPLVNIVVAILVWMEIAKLRGKPDWIGILVIVPVIGPFVPAYLAFID